MLKKNKIEIRRNSWIAAENKSSASILVNSCWWNTFKRWMRSSICFKASSCFPRFFMAFGRMDGLDPARWFTLPAGVGSWLFSFAAFSSRWRTGSVPLWPFKFRSSGDLNKIVWIKSSSASLLSWIYILIPYYHVLWTYFIGSRFKQSKEYFLWGMSALFSTGGTQTERPRICEDML